jgi:hypothetical protein
MKNGLYLEEDSGAKQWHLVENDWLTNVYHIVKWGNGGTTRIPHRETPFVQPIMTHRETLLEKHRIDARKFRRIA